MADMPQTSDHQLTFVVYDQLVTLLDAANRAVTAYQGYSRGTRLNVIYDEMAALENALVAFAPGKRPITGI